MSSNVNIRQAVRFLCAAAGAAATSMTYTAPAVAADTVGPNPDASADTSLTEVVVTGTRVRRVDAETADPVFVLGQAEIAQSGAVTVGDLVNRIPSIAGAATNPSVNNGGGFGESNIELRGLQANRTLILIDGRRVNLVGASGAVDVNAIPINLIDHVDVLKEGAGSTYGSDAIAGVVNFVTRKDVDGFELTGDWGESSKHDAQHHNFGLVWGNHGDKLDFTIGANYNQQAQLTMGDRNWSKYALYLYSGAFAKAGSSRVPTGRAFLNTTQKAAFGCSSVTRIAGAAGTTPADYRCYTGADSFNYQPYNLNVTPQERTALFSKVNYKINDYAEVYGNAIFNHTHSAATLAPLPFDANADEVVISKNSIYNPFGYDFGGGNAVGNVNPNYTLRLLALGTRHTDTSTDTYVTNFGVRGEIWTTGWNYDANVSYNRRDATAGVSGYLQSAGLANAVGPSFIDPTTGAATCGTPTAPITGCVPVDIFNLAAPSQIAALGTITAHYDNDEVYTSKVATLDVNGPVYKLPWAGTMLASLGASYTDLFDNFEASSLNTLEPPDLLHCEIAQEACTSNERNGYNYKEVYGELFVPILQDLPGVKALNLDIGERYSDYSAFGSTNRGTLKVEYRPISDFLARGTVAQVFRAPTLADIGAGATVNSPTFNDPCAGYTGAPTAAFPNLPAACKGVPTDGSFSEPNNQITGLVTSNPNLKPETGLVKTFGIVYDPSYVKGLSVSVDYWYYYIQDILTTLDPNYAANQCAITAAAEFCNLLNRVTTGGPNAGQFIDFVQPTFNLGKLTTDGVDFSLKYTYHTGLVGDFNFTVDETHLMTYKSTAAPGAATQEVAGTYNKQFGFFAKDRGTATVGWSGFDANALLTARYIGRVNIPETNAFFDDTGTFEYFGGYHLGSVFYFDLSGGYTIKATGTSLRAGILNLADKTPPIGGINSFSVGSSVTDVTTYDTIGRRFYVGLTQKF